MVLGAALLPHSIPDTHPEAEMSDYQRWQHDEILQLRATVAMLRAALEWYADEQNYKPERDGLPCATAMDGGETAKRALDGGGDA